ncbi:MAG: hypothetical protein AB1473_11590 [Thermodesulfobacteriota bacterium]
MVRLTFYPLGNADTCLIDFQNGRKMLVDYAHCRSGEEESDLRIDLRSKLIEDLEEADRDWYDVVAFSHADDDHVRGASDFFYFDHAKKYQGAGRAKIAELWVPASMVLEQNLDGDAGVIRAEARHRLRQGAGIRVFSRPSKLTEWFKAESLDPSSRERLMTDAGQLVPGFTTNADGVEFFVHSPFAFRDGEGLQDRNEGSLVLHVTFTVEGRTTCCMLGADTPCERWTDVVNITLGHNRDERLVWDVFKLPHHCSYLSLSPDKGKNKTEPVPAVKWLFDQGRPGGIIVSPSDPIPANDDNSQPPHRQAANYYRDVVATIDGDFVVTMEHPKKSRPEPLVIEIGGAGALLKKSLLGAGPIASLQPTPRAGGVGGC